MLYALSITLLCCALLSINNGFADDPGAAEKGEKGIQAFRQGDLILAMELLNDAALLGYTPAQTTLAYILDQAEENQRAFTLFQQAAEKNHAPAQFGLGNMYAKGEGTNRDPARAAHWIKKAALQHHAPAMRAYAYALEFGNLGLDINPDQALQWYTRCSQASDIICTRRLVQVYRHGGLGQSPDQHKAVHFNHQLNKHPEE